MSEPVTRTRQAIAEEAAEWFVELREAPPRRVVKDRFANWLSESPMHVEEYLGIAKVFGALQQVDPKGEIDAVNLADETVVALHGEFEGLTQGVRETGSGPSATRAGDELAQQDSSGELQQQGGHRSRTRVRAATRSMLHRAGRVRTVQRFSSWAAAAALVLGVGIAALYIESIGPEVYATALGEQRSVVLQDGSMVSLNTSTKIEVTFTDERRQVHLVQGEALFEVEKDPSRAFWVETESAVIKVTGTRFNVYQQGKDTAVTVLQGQVEVRQRGAARQVAAASERDSAGDSRSPGGGVASLTAGDQAVVKSGSAEIKTITVANLEPVMAWTERRFVFDATPLSEIVQQFNRYNREQLVIDDPALSQLELSGVFGSQDPESLVLFLKRISEVETIKSSDGAEIRIRAARSTH